MVGGVTPSTWNFGSNGPHWSEIADFEPQGRESAQILGVCAQTSAIVVNIKPARTALPVLSTVVNRGHLKVRLRWATWPASFTYWSPGSVCRWSSRCSSSSWRRVQRPNDDRRSTPSFAFHYLRDGCQEMGEYCISLWFVMLRRPPRDSVGSVGGARRPESRGRRVRCRMVERSISNSVQLQKRMPV